MARLFVAIGLSMLLLNCTAGVSAAADEPKEKPPAEPKEKLLAAGAYFTGTIGKLKVQMELQPRKGVICGSYFYESVGTRLSLSGKAKDGEAAIDERAWNDKADDKKTGQFKGELDFAKDTFSGTWTSADGKKTLAFELKKTADIVELKSVKGKATASVRYPVLLGKDKALAQVNKEVAGRARNSVKDFMVNYADEDVKQEVAFDSQWRIWYYCPQFISIHVGDYTFSGGTHGSTSSSSFNCRITDGVAREVELKDVFLMASEYRKVLDDMCLAELKKQGAPDAVHGVAKTTGSEFANFTISPKGIAIHFGEYEVPHISGTFTAEIPLEKLAKVLDNEGPVNCLLPQK